MSFSPHAEAGASAETTQIGDATDCGVRFSRKARAAHRRGRLVLVRGEPPDGGGRGSAFNEPERLPGEARLLVHAGGLERLAAVTVALAAHGKPITQRPRMRNPDINVGAARAPAAADPNEGKHLVVLIPAALHFGLQLFEHRRSVHEEPRHVVTASDRPLPDPAVGNPLDVRMGELRCTHRIPGVQGSIEPADDLDMLLRHPSRSIDDVPASRRGLPAGAAEGHSKSGVFRGRNERESCPAQPCWRTALEVRAKREPEECTVWSLAALNGGAMPLAFVVRFMLHG